MEVRKRHRSTIRTAVLTLRMTEEEMLRFKVAALGLRKKRSRIVRERVADLISGTPVAQEAPVVSTAHTVMPAEQVDTSVAVVGTASTIMPAAVGDERAIQ